MCRFAIPMLIFSCLSLTQLAAKNPEIYMETGFGKTYFGNETIKNIHACGKVVLDATQVTESLNVNGDLQANDAQIANMAVNGKSDLRNCSVKEMKINGHIHLDNCSIERESLVNGFLVAVHTTFSEKLTASSPKLIFEDCQLDSIHMKKDSEENKTQVIELKKGTKVDGSITFESVKGEVILSSDSVVTGKIIGGKIIRQ